MFSLCKAGLVRKLHLLLRVALFYKKENHSNQFEFESMLISNCPKIKMTKYQFVKAVYHPDVCDGQDLWHHEYEKVLHMEGHSFKNAETEI